MVRRSRGAPAATPGVPECHTCARRLIRETYEPAQTVETSVFGSATDASVVEVRRRAACVALHAGALMPLLPSQQVGPRLNFSTAWSANAVSIFRSCGLTKVTRAECSRRFRLRSDAGKFDLSAQQLAIFAAEVRAKHCFARRGPHELRSALTAACVP